MRSLAFLIALTALTAAGARAQSLEASTPEAAWSLVKDLPLATRLTLTTIDQEFDATLAAVRGDDLLVTDASLERTTLRQATGSPSGFIVPRASLTGARVKKLGNKYKATAGDTPNLVTVRHVLGALGTRNEVEIRTRAPKPITGRIDSISDTSVTVVRKKKPTEVALSDISAVRTKPALTPGEWAGMGALLGGLLVVLPLIIASRV